MKLDENELIRANVKEMGGFQNHPATAGYFLFGRSTIEFGYNVCL